MLKTKWALDHEVELPKQSPKYIGYIPAHDKCPFVTRCHVKQDGRCLHTGDAPTPFLCKTALDYDNEITK